MNIKDILIYLMTIFITALTVNIYGSWQAPVPIINLLATSAFFALLLTMPCTIAFYFGIKQSKSLPDTSRIILGALFTYFFSYSVCVVLGLFEISWFTFVAMGAVVAFLAGWRIPANKASKPTAKSASA